MTRNSQKSHFPKQISTPNICHHTMYKCIAIHISFYIQNFEFLSTFMASFPVYSYFHLKSIGSLSLKGQLVIQFRTTNAFSKAPAGNGTTNFKFPHLLSFNENCCAFFQSFVVSHLRRICYQIEMHSEK